MLRLTISPLARAVGVMGATAALVGGVTFATLTSNTVTLTDNTLASATPHLRISNTADCSALSTTATGMVFDELVPGVQSAAFPFCLNNDGDIPLNITAQIPTDLSGSVIPANKVTLVLDCGSGGSVTGTLADLSVAKAFLPNAPLVNATSWNCTAKATLDVTFSGSGAVTPFTINFVGTQVVAS